jgi:hypothetical protein
MDADDCAAYFSSTWPDAGALQADHGPKCRCQHAGHLGDDSSRPCHQRIKLVMRSAPDLIWWCAQNAFAVQSESFRCLDVCQDHHGRHAGEPKMPANQAILMDAMVNQSMPSLRSIRRMMCTALSSKHSEMTGLIMHEAAQNHDDQVRSCHRLVLQSIQVWRFQKSALKQRDCTCTACAPQCKMATA